ncbi:MAG: glycosyltransferase family 4 protein [Candidatus Omnitrophota bacterium]
MDSIVESGKERLRGIAFWRDNLNHANKTKDNHFRFLGKYFDFTLVVASGADIGKHVTDSGTKLVRIPCPEGPAGKVIFYLGAFRYFFREHARRPFKFFLATISEEPIGMVAKAVAFPRIKVVYDLFDIPGTSVKDDNFLTKVARLFYRLVLSLGLRRGDITVAGVIPEGLAPWRIPPERIIESENAVDAGLFDPEQVRPLPEYWKGEGKKLLYVGYVHKERGAADILQAVAKVNGAGIPVSLLIVGPAGSQNPSDLCEIAESLGIAERVSIHSHVDSRIIPGIVNASDICLCPLRDIRQFRWSYPVKVYEFLAMGKPVVATGLPGIARVVKHGENGLLFKPGDLEGFSECIVRLATDDDLYRRVCAGARDSVLGKTWENNVAIISRLVAERL